MDIIVSGRQRRAEVDESGLAVVGGRGESLLLTRWPGKTYRTADTVEYQLLSGIADAWDLVAQLPKLGHTLLDLRSSTSGREVAGVLKSGSVLNLQALHPLEDQMVRGKPPAGPMLVVALNEDTRRLTVMPWHCIGGAGALVLRGRIPAGGLGIPLTRDLEDIVLYRQIEDLWPVALRWHGKHRVSGLALPPGSYLLGGWSAEGACTFHRFRIHGDERTELPLGAVSSGRLSLSVEFRGRNITSVATAYAEVRVAGETATIELPRGREGRLDVNLPVGATHVWARHRSWRSRPTFIDVESGSTSTLTLDLDD